MITWDRTVVYERPKTKMICSFQNILKITCKKIFMECMEEKEPLGRDEADAVSLTSDSRNKILDVSSFCFLHQKWYSN